MTHCVGDRMFLEENIHPSTGESHAHCDLTESDREVQIVRLQESVSGPKSAIGFL